MKRVPAKSVRPDNVLAVAAQPAAEEQAAGIAVTAAVVEVAAAVIGTGTDSPQFF